MHPPGNDHSNAVNPDHASVLVAKRRKRLLQDRANEKTGARPRAPLHFLVLVQLERSRIDAVALVGGGRPIVKNMPKMGITAFA